MKKYCLTISCILLIVYSALCITVAALSKSIVYPIFALHILIVTAAAVCAAVFSANRPKPQNIIEKIASYAVLPLAIIFSVSHAMAADVSIHLWGSFIIAAAVTICAILAMLCSVTSKPGKYILLSLCSGVISLCALIAFLAGMLSYNICDTKKSPGGIFTAIICKRFSDSMVATVQNSGINLGFAKIVPASSIIYESAMHYGNSPKKIEVTWKNDYILLINGEEYSALSIYAGIGAYIPERDPDYYTDSHGGFLGDGTMISVFNLSPEEEATVLSDIDANQSWQTYYSVTDWMTRAITFENEDILNGITTGYYVFFDKQTGSHEIPVDSVSYNYVYALYSAPEHKLYLVDFDT